MPIITSIRQLVSTLCHYDTNHVINWLINSHTINKVINEFDYSHYHVHCFCFSHCSGVRVFMVKAWIDFISSSKHELTILCLCKRGLPVNLSDTIITLKLVSHLSAVMSITS